MNYERAIIIKGKTRLEKLLDRYNSKSQAQFYINHNGGDFSEYESEHEQFYNGFNYAKKIINRQLKSTVLERNFLPSFLFEKNDLIVVVGQDGLVANTAKYVSTNPIFAINPDLERNMGALLPFDLNSLSEGYKRILRGQNECKHITLAKAKMNDGQELLAFNDFYIGKSNHSSSRYKIIYQGRHENQSSSGIIISTGAGSTAWLSSVLNEFRGLEKFLGYKSTGTFQSMEWDDDKLCYIVREPYKSPNFSTDMVAGYVNKDEKLIIESLMPDDGVIFSDGIMEDYLVFNSGRTVTITKAHDKAKLII
ncbi:sugar kinase [Marivirga tractuosa]|uniref:Sugar kinase n=1 Tax=Marivirga tractuosa (strain ATCC 23168 / DSM 4126 / NBRC 15989 / NCIMB 1408 / VKM B-1430 / H-43) TaxID=643867 RepID=E4TQD8_MARTH|nr:hypothetical protein [Marivirga tractuosa]ADR22661.1 hypothetical protein Ftrac_2683 [Marivirga tractuosa DSM 4126]BDD16668.1 sugar kinase [Marivirga tractuosa]